MPAPVRGDDSDGAHHHGGPHDDPDNAPYDSDASDYSSSVDERTDKIRQLYDDGVPLYTRENIARLANAASFLDEDGRLALRAWDGAEVRCAVTTRTRDTPGGPV